MQGTIVIAGYSVDYIITEKRIKNVNFHLYADRVEINIPRGMRQEYVMQCIERHIEHIKRGQGRLRTTLRCNPTYAEGGQVSLGGRIYKIAVDSLASNVSMSGDTITFCGSGSGASVQAAFLKLLAEQTQQNVRRAMQEVFPKFSGYRIEYPTLKFKNMVSLWGRCYTASCSLVLNNALGLLPYECLEYIVVHELAHLVVPNHSAAFHAVVSKIMPQWKECKKVLRQYDLHKYFDKV